MDRCPKCNAEVAKLARDLKYGRFTVKFYKCPCGNQFVEWIKGEKLSFILSAHNGTLRK